MSSSEAIRALKPVDAYGDEAKYRRWPFTSPCYEPAAMNGLRTQQFLESKIVYTDFATLDYFEVRDGTGGLHSLFHA